MEENDWQFETKAIRTQAETTQHNEHSVPMYLTSGFVYDDAEEMRATFAGEKKRNIYARFTHPNGSEFVDKMCALEGAEAGVATASGMAAVFATFAAHLNQGDHIVSCRSIFGSTHGLFTKILPKWGITTSYAPVDDLSAWDALVTPATKMVYAETPTNPGIEILDLEALGAFAKRHNLILVIDNCFATSYVQQPIAYGADLVIHSATKFIDGQGRAVGGVVVGSEELIEPIFLFGRTTGPSLSPFNAWLLSKSLETLAVRMDRHAENALAVAEALEKHPCVEQVRYPFLASHPQMEVAKRQMKNGGGLVAFTIKGGLEAGKQFLDALQLCSLTANLGDTRTIVTHPASTTHARLSEEERALAGIAPGLIRISVGLENIKDILKDLEQAFSNA